VIGARHRIPTTVNWTLRFRARTAALAGCAGLALAAAQGWAQSGSTSFGAPGSDDAGVASPASALRDDASAAAIARDIGEGLQATEETEARRPARSASGAGKPQPNNRALASDDPTGLRERGKSLVRWIKSHLPWTRDEDEDPTPVHQARETSQWAEPALGGERRRGTPIGDASPGERYASAYPAPREPTGDSGGRPFGRAPEDDPLQRITEVLRLIVEHPMTWLIVALVAIGAYAVKKFDRRPK
jgi:hypothetical protein